MKAFKLIIRDDGITSKTLLKAVLENPQQRGTNVGDIRKRCKILDKLDETEGDTMTLEDADHSFLVNILNNFTFAVATKQVLEIIDAVVDAKEP